MLKRLKPSKSDVGVVSAAGLLTALPFLTAAAPHEGGGELVQIITAAVVAAGSAAGGLLGKGALIFLWSFLRRKGHKMLSDKNPDNDELGRAVIDTVDRLDPDGKPKE
jgi:hypothetical protein